MGASIPSSTLHNHLLPEKLKRVLPRIAEFAEAGGAFGEEMLLRRAKWLGEERDRIAVAVLLAEMQFVGRQVGRFEGHGGVANRFQFDLSLPHPKREEWEHKFLLFVRAVCPSLNGLAKHLLL